MDNPIANAATAFNKAVIDTAFFESQTRLEAFERHVDSTRSVLSHFHDFLGKDAAKRLEDAFSEISKSVAKTKEATTLAQGIFFNNFDLEGGDEGVEDNSEG